MFLMSPGFYGASMSSKELALTFDDGPTAQSLSLATYLNEQGIRATFFVIGSQVAANPDIVRQVANLGHLIGNHTYNHVSMAGQTLSYVEHQVMSTDALITEAIGCAPSYFRPPWGYWDGTVPGQLNVTPSAKYVGPVMWSIDEKDWQYWDNPPLGSPIDCAIAYLKAINSQQRGIILMHDRGGILQAVQYMVENLKASGFIFRRMDELGELFWPAVSSTLALQAKNGCFISPQQGGGGQVLVNGPSIGAWEPMGLVQLDPADPSKVALRCVSGKFISPQNNGGGAILANGPGVGLWEQLKMHDLGDDNIALQCGDGSYFSLQQGGGGVILANATSIGDWEALKVVRLWSSS